MSLCLLAAVDLFAIQATADRPESRNLPSVSRAEFLRFVIDGKTIESRTIPVAYVQEIMETADDTWLKKHRDAALRIRHCVVTGMSLRPRLPEVSATTVSPSVQRWLKPGQRSIGSLRLGLDVRHSTITSQLSLANTLIARGVHFENVIFEKNIDLSNSIFEQELEVVNGAFKGLSMFAGIAPLIRAGFNNVGFTEDADFTFVRLPEGSKLAFRSMKFPRDFKLYRSTIEGDVRFTTVAFGSGAYFNQLSQPQSSSPHPVRPVGLVSFVDVSFVGRAYFDQSRLATLTFCPDTGHALVTFAQPVTFAEGEFGQSCFKEVEFKASSTFASRFAGTVDFRAAHFAEGADFSGADFEKTTKVQLAGFRFDKPLSLRCQQMKHPLSQADATSREEERAYQALLDNFRHGGDAESENECLYAVREHFRRNWFAKAIWGYGVRPWRTFFCILIFFAGMVLLKRYLLGQTRSDHGERRKPWWDAVVIAFETSWLKAPPLHYASGGVWKLLIIGEWAIMKALQLVFLIACQNTSRLLEKLASALMPG